ADAQFPAMRMLRLAGDRTTRRDLALFRKHFGAHCLLRVGLGASEALLYAQHFLTPADEIDGEVVPVGHAVADMELLLLNEAGQPVPPGEYGEIAVRSRYLSLGYWRNPALTAQRFLPDPAGDGQRVYLSRDIGYVDAQGLLHHVGRSDSRVKLHGRMVVVSDVEEILLAMPGVREAVVAPYDGGANGTELAAFVVAPGLAVRDLRRALAQRLPAGLLPRRVELLDSLPLQLNNKINRLKLKELCQGDT
ncbi:MAG TPA: AMP-binding protein, partial [Hyphomicrobiales bacterium]|nr:AMP-binding protein [Hyphomicrobiales bacterium]